MTLGTLYLVATPIGNLEDITIRALGTLREVDLIACEDTRVTKGLLSHYGLSKPLLSYRQGVEQVVAGRIIQSLRDGDSVALVTDAGTPLLSDPGFPLVRRIVREGIPMEIIPGPSAVIAALALSGLPPEPFAFFGFLPRRGTARKNKIEAAAGFNGSLIFFESPRRIDSLLTDLAGTMGDRTAVLIRELTKVYQEVIRGTFEELATRDLTTRGEFTLVVGPPPDESAEGRPQEESLRAAAAFLIQSGTTLKTARDKLTEWFAVSKREAYRIVHQVRDELPD